MTVTCIEKVDSREITRGDSPSARLQYIIRGTDDHDQALSKLALTAPETFEELARMTYNVEPVYVDENAGGSRGIWNGHAEYGRRQFTPTGESVYQFDTGGGSQHITQSRATVARYARPGTIAGNFMGAIGVSGDGVDGADITVPVYNFSEVHYKSRSFVDDSYKAALFDLTGTVNSRKFRMFAAGEVLFLGASGTKRGGEDWELTYRFAASPNRTGIVIGDIAGISKGGWEYLWVQYADEEDTNAQTLIKRPLSVHIERVYRYENLDRLRL